MARGANAGRSITSTIADRPKRKHFPPQALSWNVSPPPTAEVRETLRPMEPAAHFGKIILRTE